MANDPRTSKLFAGSFCPQMEAGANAKTKEKGDFVRALKKLGGLEAWNDVGLGGVGEGLRAVTAVSDTLRLGGSAFIPDTINAGGNWVLDQCGVEGASFNKLTDFQPGVANRAVNAGRQVWRRAKDGNFQVQDIPQFVGDIQNAVNLAGSIFGGFDKPDAAKGGAAGKAMRAEMCQPSPFAMDLIKFAPKYKFLFVLDITYSEPYTAWNQIKDGMAFVVLTSTRPRVEFEYEDVNMYNFWTRVAKRTIYPPMSMKFYDDNYNNGHLFYSSYMRAMSPIANLKTNDNILDGKTTLFQEQSMNFNKENTINTFAGNGPNLENEYAASLGPLLDNTTSIIKTIKLFHVFQYGALMNVYSFTNPRINSMELDELNMAESGPTELSFEFNYDKLFVESGVDVQAKEFGYDLEQLTSKNVAFFPISPVFGPNHDVTEFQPNAPTAEKQENSGNGASVTPGQAKNLNNAVDASGKITQGVAEKTGVLNTGVNNVTGVASNAFKAVKNFGGSFFT